MITPVPWFERKFDFNFPVGLFPIIVERLRGTYLRLEPLGKMPDSLLSLKKEEKWSIKEIIGHLYDLEELWDRRVDDFLDQRDTLHAADLNNTKTHNANHNSSPIADLLHRFGEARSRLIKKVEKMDETFAARTALHPRLQKPMRLVDSLFFVAEHDDHELAKIRAILNS